MNRVFVALLLVATSAIADSRTWTDAKGTHHSTADLADFQGGVAYLRKDDGKTIAVPLAKLSKADQSFIKSTVPVVNVITGKVVGITDGDTLRVLEGTTVTKVRLEGIDAPESHQAYGTKSREALAAKVFQKNVRVEWRELDKYHRTLGHVFVDDRWVNKDMVQEGWAWHYRKYSTSDVLADAESDARTETAGLWADSSPIPPWDFRHPTAPAALAAIPASAAAPDPAPVVVAPKKKPPSSAVANDDPSAATPPRSVDRNPDGEQVTGHTATGIPTFTGPRGGQYHYSKSGNKVYEKRKR